MDGIVHLLFPLRTLKLLSTFRLLVTFINVFWCLPRSFGMAFLTFFHIYAENEQGIFDAVLRGHIDFSSDPWPSISTSAKDLVKKMLCADPKERLSAVEVLSKFHNIWTF